ncbi:MAG: 1-deoxy-D-xylulose-5-phosphate synthase [Candidatus Marinimicrobia bacterium]|nr:1-deoxy-D-xylulose-5-phosphate synthase [Candidatus Neomarinimicrobiota bacterium]
MKKDNILDLINSPKDLKDVSIDDLGKLSLEISDLIKKTVKENGGHYSSPLGVVDLTIALHYVYDTPKDKLIWDVGHQAYSHKILTGRKDVFNTIRKKDGISGFLKISESEYDCYGAGHSSTSISAALGFAHSRDKNFLDHKVVAIIGDGAMTGGLSYEAINNLGYHKTQLCIILNDNSKSISDSVGALSRYLSKIITNPSYNLLRNKIWNIVGKIPFLKNRVKTILKKSEESLKSFLTPGGLFEELGLRYIGPIDGHDIKSMIKIFENVKKIDSPVLIHVLTKKGKSSKNAESDSIKYYSLSGKQSNKKLKSLNYSDVFGKSVLSLAKDNDFICITAAMEIGTGLREFSEKFSHRIIDVGIAEGHALAYASGLSAANTLPIIALYSTFSQRAYDNIIHDLLLQELPFILCLDRSGIVGEDGPTHHGLYDINMFISMPGVIIAAPKDGDELRNLLYTAVKIKKSFVVRYPKGSCITYNEKNNQKLIKVGKWELLKKGDKSVILAVGSMVDLVLSNYNYLCSYIDYNPTIINCRYIKPIDYEMIDEIIESYDNVITIEEGVSIGGFGSFVSGYLNSKKYAGNIEVIGIDDEFVSQGSRKELLEDCGLCIENIADKIKKMKKNEKK